MAIKLPVKIHPDYEPVEAYLMIHQAQKDRVLGGLLLHFWVFSSQAARDRMRAAVADEAKYGAIVRAAQAARTAPENQDKAVIENIDAQSALAKARHEIQAAISKKIQPADIPSPLTVPLDQVHECLGENGEPDLGRCYEWVTEHLNLKGEEA